MDFRFTDKPFVSPTKITHRSFFPKDCHHLVTFTRRYLLFAAVKIRLFFVQLHTKRKRTPSRLCGITFLGFHFAGKVRAHKPKKISMYLFWREQFPRQSIIFLDFPNGIPNNSSQMRWRFSNFHALFLKWKLMYNVPCKFIVPFLLRG